MTFGLLAGCIGFALMGAAGAGGVFMAGIPWYPFILGIGRVRRFKL